MVADVAAWRRWLAANHSTSDGVWLVLAKGGAVTPTRLRYQEALEEALAHGWIDGQALKRDQSTYGQRFTPRRKRSPWSQRNTKIAERLIEEGRMRPAGAAEIERAKSDGRWQAAYRGSQGMEVPDDLAAVLDASPAAKALFAGLSSRNRYSILYRIQEARRPETRARRIAGFVAMLQRGETIFPQPQRPEGWPPPAG